MAVWSEEKVRGWTNQRLKGAGPVSSIGKVHQASLNQKIQLLAADLLGPGATAWEGDTPFELSGMLRSRANTIEGGTSEVNKNILGERVLGLPREPDPWADAPWEEIPRS
jgi:alkylation response protein AidB-like acyl-CoA dehydrogenase